MLVVLVFLNIRGLGESANLNFILACVDLATQVLVVALGAVLVLNPSRLISQVHLGTAPSVSQLIFAASIAMLAYTGIETVSNMAEESKDPGKDVPRAVNLVLIAVLGVYMGISVVALSALPVVHTRMSSTARTSRPRSAASTSPSRCSGSSSTSASTGHCSRASSTTSACSRRRSSSSRPTPG